MQGLRLWAGSCAGDGSDDQGMSYGPQGKHTPTLEENTPDEGDPTVGMEGDCLEYETMDADFGSSDNESNSESNSKCDSDLHSLQSEFDQPFPTALYHSETNQDIPQQHGLPPRGTNANDQGLEEGVSSDGHKPRGFQWYREHQAEPLFQGCRLTVLQVAFAFLSLKLRFHITEVALDALCALLAQTLLPEANYMPHNMYMVRRLCNVESPEAITYHCCEDDHYIWPYLPVKEYAAHRNDTCPIAECGKPRFKVRKSPTGPRFTPLKIVYYFGLKRCINYLHSLPWWNQAREEVDRNVNTASCTSFFGSRLSKEMNIACQGRLADLRIGLYEIGTDWFSFFADKRQSITTGLMAIRAIDLPDDKKQKREGHVPLMVMTGGEQPKSMDAYVDMVVKDFEHWWFAHGLQVQKACISKAQGVIVIQQKPVLHLPLLVSWVGDNPARQKVAQFRGHAAMRACPYCWMTGISKHNKMVFLGYSKDIIIDPSFIPPTRPLTLPLGMRVGDEWAQKTCQEMVLSGNKVCDSIWEPNVGGCNGISAVIRLPYVNYRDVWTLGIAHILLLGLVPDFMRQIFVKKRQGQLPSFAVEYDQRQVIKQRCAALCMPTGCQATLSIVDNRGIFNMSDWWLHTK